MNRTALHYANSLPEADRDAVVTILTDASADTSVEDCKGKKPEDYIELAEELQAMREDVPQDAPAEAAGEEAPAAAGEAPAAAEEASAATEEAPAAPEEAPAAEA